MFFGRSRSSHRSPNAPARRNWFGSRVDQQMDWKRGYRCHLNVEPLEDRRMLAILLGPSDDIETLNDAAPPAGQNLGHDAFVTIDNFTLNDGAGDTQDVFIYRPNATGKLLVSSITSVGFAGFTLDVQDSTGASLLGGAVGGGVDRSLPVVADQVYFVVASDTTADAAGGAYTLELENLAAPVPSSVTLSPASDTGASNSDGVTADNTPTFFIQDDIAGFLPIPPFGTNLGAIDSNGANGYDVQLVATNLSTGATTNVNATRLGASATWTATTPVLADGQYLVSARTVVVDATSGGAGGANTGFSQLSTPIFVTIDTAGTPVTGTIDLLASSDTGAFSVDNVTSTRTPAFTGVGPQNGRVTVFAQATNAAGAPTGPQLLVGSGTVGSDNTDGTPGDGQGQWQVTTIPIDDGLWLFTAQFEDSAGNLSGQIGLNSVGLTAAPGTLISNTSPPATSTQTVTAGSFSTPGLPPGSIFSPVSNVTVTANITHPLDSTINLTLTNPAGNTINLSTGNGAGANYTNTVFTDAAATAITAGASPFTGMFRPEQPLSTFDGQNAIGNWTLTVTDTANDGSTGTLDNWTLNITTPLPVVIDTIAPGLPLLDVVNTSDTGRSSVDDITSDNTPTVQMTTTDSPISASSLLFTDNLRFIVYNRFGGAAETIIYDSATDNAVDTSPGGLGPVDGLTVQTIVTETLPTLADGVNNLRLEVLDRAGNISDSFLLEVIVDTTAPPVSFGLVNMVNATDGIFDGSDTGTANNGASFSDRVTADTTPTMWGNAEANAIVSLWLDANNDGVIQTTGATRDIFLGQTVANPEDGNLAFPVGYWQISSAVDLNDLTTINATGGAFTRDGARPLLVSAQDVAGNPIPVGGVIDPTTTPSTAPAGTVLDALTVFLDTQGPQITGVSINTLPTAAFGGYDLFDPKPSVNGFTPLVNSVTVNFADLPARLDGPGVVNDFLYPALDPTVAGAIGNYSVVGDHVGEVVITAATVNQALKLAGTVTAPVGTTTTFTDAGLTVAATVPAMGDFILFNNGANAGQARMVTAFNGVTGLVTVDAAFSVAPAVGDGYAVITAASLLHAAPLLANTQAQATVTAATNATTFTAANLLITALVGDYVLFNTGAAAGQIARVTATAAGGTTITVAAPGFAPAPAVGDSFTLFDNGTFFAWALNTASVTLTFANPLPDDRFTLVVSDNLTDSAGNRLDGESNASSPTATPTFVTGDGVAGGAFDGRFTIDSRPEIGSFVPQGINLDINGNFVWDPFDGLGDDQTNVDLTFTLPAFNGGNLISGGLSTHDIVFAGRFAPVAGPSVTNGNLFDQLAAYGSFPGAGGTGFRWLVDFNSDGVVNTAAGEIINVQPSLSAFGFSVVGALPIAGNFDANAANGDEVGLYRQGTWVLDSLKSYTLTGADTFVTNGLQGHPVVGDFDGDSLDDLAVFNDNIWYFDLANDGLGDFFGNANADQTLVWGLPGVLDRPVVADMDQDGVDDLGMWVPRTGAGQDRVVAEWYWLVSGSSGVAPAAGTINTLNHGFSTLPPSLDIYAEFGDELALPIAGNFDPPVATVPSLGGAGSLAGDYLPDGVVNEADITVWMNNYGGTNPAADGNGDGVVDALDFAIVRENYGARASTPAPAPTYAPVTYSNLPEHGPAFSGGDATFAFAPPAYSSTAGGQSSTSLSGGASGSTAQQTAGDSLLLLAAAFDDYTAPVESPEAISPLDGEPEEGDSDDESLALALAEF